MQGQLTSLYSEPVSNPAAKVVNSSKTMWSRPRLNIISVPDANMNVLMGVGSLMMAFDLKTSRAFGYFAELDNSYCFSSIRNIQYIK